MKKRGFFRKPRVVCVDVTSEDGFSAGSTLNVSPGGMGIRVPGKKNFQSGEEVLLEARSHGKIYQMKGIVKWIEPGEPASTIGIELEMDGSGFLHDALNDTGEIVEPASSVLRVIYLSPKNMSEDWEKEVRFGRVKVNLLPPHPERNTTVMVHFSVENQNWEVMAKGLVTSCEIDSFQVLLDNPEKLHRDFLAYLPELSPISE
jgi:hypothetical protein